jgi:hypothetical protein
MRLYLVNPSNPLVSILKVKESRWNRYRVWKPLSLLVLAGLTPPEWETSIVDENLGVPDYRLYLAGEPCLRSGGSFPAAGRACRYGWHSRHDVRR